MTDTNQQLSFTELRELATLNTLPAILMAPDLIEKRKALIARQPLIARQDAARATTAALPLSKGLNRNTRRTHGIASQTSKNAVDLADLSGKEQLAIRRMQHNPIVEAQLLKAMGSIDHTLEDAAAVKGLLTTVTLGAKNMDAMVRIDQGTHATLLSGATDVDPWDYLYNNIMQWGRFPEQRTRNKLKNEQISAQLKWVVTDGGTFDDLRAWVKKGWAYTPCSFDLAKKYSKDSRTQKTEKIAVESNSNCHAVIMDIDAAGLTREKLNAAMDKLGAVAIDTASSKPEHIKARIFFFLKSPIKAEVYAKAITFFSTLLYSELGVNDDFSTHHASRFYFGATDAIDYQPPTIKLYNVEETTIDAGLHFRTRHLIKRKRLAETLDTTGDWTLRLDVLTANLKAMSEIPGFESRVSGGENYTIFRNLCWAMGNAVKQELMTEEEGRDMLSVFGDPEGTIDKLFMEAACPPKDSNTPIITYKSLGFILRELLGSACKGIYQCDRAPTPFNLSQGCKPDITYSFNPELPYSEQERPLPAATRGMFLVDSTHTGGGKSAARVNQLRDRAWVAKYQQDTDVDYIVVCHTSLEANSAKPYLAIPNSVRLDGRRVTRYRYTTSDVWIETDEHMSEDDRRFFMRNMKNQDLVNIANDPDNKLIQALINRGFNPAEANKVVKTGLGHTLPSEYEIQEAKAHRKHSPGTVINMAGGKFDDFWRKVRAKNPHATCGVFIEEAPTFMGLINKAYSACAADFHKLLNIKGPGVAGVAHLFTQWFAHMASARYVPATIEAFVEFAKKNDHQAALEYLEKHGRLIDDMDAHFDTANNKVARDWLDAHKNDSRLRGAQGFVEAIHGSIGTDIARKDIINIMRAIHNHLVTGEITQQSSYDSKTGIWSIITRNVDLPALVASGTFTIMAANQSPEMISEILGIPGKTIAHEDFYSNAQMGNLKYLQYTMSGLTGMEIPSHILSVLNLTIAHRKPELIFTAKKFVNQIKALPSVQALGTIVTHHGGNAAIGSNEYESVSNMMIIGLPRPNIGGSQATLTNYLGRSPSALELSDYQHQVTENGILQEIGRTRSVRRQDQEITVTLVTQPEAWFIAPVGADPDLEDADQLVDRIENIDIRNDQASTFDHLRQLLVEASEAGDKMPYCADLTSIIGKTCKSSIRNALKAAGFGGLKDLWNAICATRDKQIADSAAYLEKREEALARLQPAKDDFKMLSMQDKTGRIAVVAMQLFSGPDLYIATNNLTHEVLGVAGHKRLLEEDLDQHEHLTMTPEDKKHKDDAAYFGSLTAEDIERLCRIT